MYIIDNVKPLKEDPTLYYLLKAFLTGGLSYVTWMYNAMYSNQIAEGSGQSPKGLIGKAFEDYLNKKLGGEGSRQIVGRDFDGVNGNRWWEIKSDQY